MLNNKSHKTLPCEGMYPLCLCPPQPLEYHQTQPGLQGRLAETSTERQSILSSPNSRAGFWAREAANSAAKRQLCQPSFQSLTCLKPPGCCSCGFMMKTFLIIFERRKQTENLVGGCTGMEQTQKLTLKHREGKNEEPFLNLLLLCTENMSRLRNCQGSPGPKLKKSH